MSDPIGDDQSLYRPVVHPLAFTSKAFDIQNMFHLQSEDDKTIVTSLVWQHFLPNEGALHEYGCRLANGMNQGIINRKGLLKEKERRAYCGSYQLTANVIRALAKTDELSEVAVADVLHEIENDEVAHINLKVTVRADWTGSITSTMTAIVDRLWRACRGPLKHTCPYDLDLSPHPSEGLPVPPTGGCTFLVAE